MIKNMSFNKSTSIPSVKATIKSDPSSTIYLEGYLNKQKHGKCKAWLKRYFRLYGEELRYYKTKNDTNALAVISLDHYSLVLDAQPLTSLNSKQWKTNSFCLVSDDETKYDWPDYNLQASTPEEKTEWTTCLERFVFQSNSVLEKWLERVELPDQEDMLAISSIDNDQPRLKHSKSSSFLSKYSNYKSMDSLQDRPNVIKRRPSDYLLHTTKSLLNTSANSLDRLSSTSKFSKLFNRSYNKSSNSSVASSTVDSMIHIPQEQDEDNMIYTHNNTTKAIEVPIINPKEIDDYYFIDQNNATSNSPILDPTTQYYYRN